MLKTVMTAAGVALTLGMGAGTALAAGDVANGEKWAMRVCKACHTFDAGGKHLIGPNLWNIMGQVPGTVEGFDRYQVAGLFVENGVATWTDDAMIEYISDPAAFREAYAGGKASAMQLAPLTPEIATDITAYLNTLKD